MINDYFHNIAFIKVRNEDSNVFSDESDNENNDVSHSTIACSTAAVVRFHGNLETH